MQLKKNIWINTVKSENLKPNVYINHLLIKKYHLPGKKSSETLKTQKAAPIPQRHHKGCTIEKNKIKSLKVFRKNPLTNFRKAFESLERIFWQTCNIAGIIPLKQEAANTPTKN